MNLSLLNTQPKLLETSKIKQPSTFVATQMKESL